MENKKILFLSSKDVRKCLTLKETIEAMRGAFSQLSSGKAYVPVRTHLDIPENKGGALFMPVYLPQSKGIGLKVVSIFKENPARNLPMIQALVLLMDAENGRPLAIMDGEYLTALRTGAASGLATDLMAKKDSHCAAIIGTGVQGRMQLRAVCAVRKITKILAFDNDEQRANEYAEIMSTELNIPIDIVEDKNRLREADVICTATSSSSPVFQDSHISQGCHINGVGSYRPTIREIPGGTMIRARIVVDSMASALKEAGDILIPVAEQLFNINHVLGELGELVKGRKVGREDDNQITVFKSVGNAVQDLAAAAVVLENARKMGLGTFVDI